MEPSYSTILLRTKKSRRDWIMNILTFIFPFLSVVTAFAFQEIYPIGERLMLTVDSYHQYAPFLIELRNKILGGRSLLYSWNSGLGMEYFAAFANYASSPLNIFCVFFTAKTMPVFAALITAVRAGLSGLFMSWFLSGEDEGRRDYVTTAFACAYALCGWFCTDFWNLMWCDALWFLPLILVGLRKLFTEGKYAWYCLSLGFAIISNYYTGFFLCIFLTFFAPVYYFCIFQTKKETIVEGKISFKSFFLSAFRFILASLIAGGISAIILLPTYKILQTTSAVGAEFPKEYELTGNLFDFLGRFLVAANPNIRDGFANVYSGIIPVLMLPLFFVADKNTGIKLRQKIGMGFMLLFLYLSFSNRTLNFIWHGFHFPNQIPYRESFLMSFLVVYIGYKTIRVLKSFSPSQLSAVFIGGAGFVVLYEKFGSGNETYVQILITILFIILEGIFLKCTMIGNKKPFFYEVLVASVMAIEMLVSCCISVAYVAKHEGFPLYKSYAQNHEIIKDYADKIELSSGHKAFERTEVYPNNICDIQSVFDVRGVSVFSSTVREKNVKFIRNFGFHNNGINSYRSAGINRVTATLLGVRNFITTGESDTVPPIFYFEETLTDDIRVYSNPDALSVGYMVSDDLLNIEIDDTIRDPFVHTNNLVNSMGIDGNIFVSTDCYIDNFSNSTVSSGINGVYTVSIIDSNTPSSFTVNINTEGTGNDVLIYLDCPKSGSFIVEKYSSKTGDLISTTGSVSYRYYQTIPLGVADGSVYKCTMKFTTSPAGAIKVYSYEMDRKVYNNMVEQLSSSELIVDSYTDTSIKGTIDVKESGLLFMSVAYNESFRLVVDGKETEITPVGDTFVATHLEPGTHTIELYYSPNGFTEGALITGICVVMLLAICVFKFLQNKKAVVSNSEEKANEISESEVAEAATNEAVSEENAEVSSKE